ILSSLPALAAAAPNIVFIVADDLGSYGSQYYETPNIDSLASAGMRFTNAYACPNCAPTRAALMSGRYCPRTGIYTVESGQRGLEKFRKMIAAENKTALALSEVTIAEVLQKAGYHTAHMGKWHLGEGSQLPTGQGFHVNIAGTAKGSPYGRRGYFSPYGNPSIKDGPEGEYLTDRLSAEAVRFLRANRNQKFFLYLPYYSVHTPITPKPELHEIWKKKKPAGTHSNAAYAAMIQSLDDGVGRVLSTLDELDLARETLVIFYSDNGGVGGYRRAGVDAFEVTDNAPLRGGKGMLYEGGVRVPLIVRFPGVVEPGTTCDEPVVNVDFYPTLLDFAGAAGNPSHKLDGVSFANLLRGGAAGERPPIYWHFPGYLQGRQEVGAWRTTPAGAIRDGEYKLIEFFETGATELYNLSEDISEQKNLVAEMPVKAKQLHEKLVSWRKATNAPMPTMKE
ncbi:MAG: sulfatase, partial [bacterium]|nr:sulfatase [bacterium]